MLTTLRIKFVLIASIVINTQASSVQQYPSNSLKRMLYGVALWVNGVVNLGHHCWSFKSTQVYSTFEVEKGRG